MRRTGHADAIARLNAPDFGTYRFHNSDTAVALDERHTGHRKEGGGNRAGRGAFPACGRGRWTEAGLRKSQHIAGIGITKVGCFRAYDDLAAADGPKRQILEGGASRACST